MAIEIRAFEENDIPEMIAGWNEIVREGTAFPQEDQLDEKSGLAFF